MAIHYNTKIVTSELKLCLDASNTKSYSGSGNTWTDLSGNGNHAIKQGNSALSTWNSAGYFEHRPTGVYGAVDANSTAADSGGCWWAIPHSTSLSPNSGYWSVCGWMRVLGTQSGNGTGWFHKRRSTEERAIHAEPIGPGSFRVNTITTWDAINSPLNTNAWAYYTVVYSQTSGVYGTDVGALKYYRNGALIQNVNSAPATDDGQEIYLGRRNGHFRHFLNGDLANYQYYTKALSDAEVLQNFSAMRGRYGV